MRLNSEQQPSASISLKSQLSAAVKICVLGGGFAAFISTFVYVMQLVANNVQDWGEAGGVMWPLAAIFAVVGIPLGLAGGFITSSLKFQLDGTVRGMKFGALIGIPVGLALTCWVAMKSSPPIPVGQLILPLLGIVVGYVIAGAAIGHKRKPA